MPSRFDLASFLAHPDTERLAAGPWRGVFGGVWDSRQVIVKIFHRRGGFRGLFDAMRRRPEHREADLALAFPFAPEVAAIVGDARRGALVTEDLSSGEAREIFGAHGWLGELQGRARDRLISQLGAWWRGVREAGWRYRDFREGHLWAQRSAPERGGSDWRFRLLDLATLRRGRATRAPAPEVEALAFVVARLDERDRMRLWRAYEPDRAARRRSWPRICRAVRSYRTRLWRKRLARCDGPGRPYLFEATSCALHASDFPLARFLDAARRPSPLVYKEEDRCRVFAVEIEGYGAVVVRAWKRRPRDLGEGRAGRAWRAFHRAAYRDLPAPRPLSLIRRAGVDGGESWVIVSQVPRCRALRQAFEDWRDRQRRPRELFELVDRLGRGLRAIHDAGLLLRDCKAGNFVVERTGAITLVDAEGLRESPVVPERERVRELARLARDFPDAGMISATLLWRLVRAYSRQRFGVPEIARQRARSLSGLLTQGMR